MDKINSIEEFTRGAGLYSSGEKECQLLLTIIGLCERKITFRELPGLEDRKGKERKFVESVSGE